MAAKHVTMPQRITTIPQYGNHDKTFHLALPRQSHHTSGFTPSFTPSRAVPSCALVDPEAGEAFVTPRLPVHTPSRLPLPGDDVSIRGERKADSQDPLVTCKENDKGGPWGEREGLAVGSTGREGLRLMGRAHKTER
uniref:Uncharacterized protein n=1 Tax=Oryza brachyantha TaxID=4533 RepID=J3N1X4_ORYBR